MEEKVNATNEAPTPKNISELRALLGIINYYGKFLPNLSTQLAPLHELLQKNSSWIWTDRQDKAFQEGNPCVGVWSKKKFRPRREKCDDFRILCNI